MLQFIIKLISWLSLGLLIIPSIGFLAGYGQLATVKILMLVASVIWFVVSVIALKSHSHP